MTDAVLTAAPDTPEVGTTGPRPSHVTPVTDARVASYISLFENTRVGSEPAWLGALRRGAIERFSRLGFPTRKNEDWHFTSVTPIVENAYAPKTGRALETSDVAPFTFAGDWQTLVFVNGRLDARLSTIDAGTGYYAGSLSGALQDDGRSRMVERYFGGLASSQGHAFTELNSAFVADGAAVVLRGDVVLDRPIHLLFVTDENAAGALVSPRNLIVLEHHAQATVVESYVSLGDAAYLTNAVTEVYVGEGARLRHYKIQRESMSANHVGSSYAHQDRDSHYEAFSFATGGDLSRTNFATILDGSGAHATLNGLYMASGEQTVDHQTRIEHAKESCTSHEIYKGVLDGESHAVFNGKVFVRPEAQKTDGKQSNNNLLLSDRARIDTKPQLEIFADDVRCTHGATVGRLDSTAMFYLKSRGIGENTARKLLTYAFAAEVLEELTVDSVRETLEALTFSRYATNT